MLAAGRVIFGWLRLLVPQVGHKPSAHARQLAAAEPWPRQRREHQVNAQSNAKHQINSLTDREVEVGRSGIAPPNYCYYRRRQDKKSTLITDFRRSRRRLTLCPRERCVMHLNTRVRSDGSRSAGSESAGQTRHRPCRWDQCPDCGKPSRARRGRGWVALSPQPLWRRWRR